MSGLFDVVVGQEAAKRRIAASIGSGRFGHAYIFTGPDGVGKTLTAREVGRWLLCPSRHGTPSDECPTCRLVVSGRHPDFNLLRAEEGRRFIQVDQVRAAEHYLSLAPISAERRVLIVQEAERMGQEAANAFLKTLEEPPDPALIILTTSRPQHLPETIRSRCMEIRFGPLEDRQVEEILCRRDDIPSERIRLASRLADGSPGKALDLIKSGCLDMYEEAIGRLMNLPGGDIFELSEDILGWARGAASRKETQRDRLRSLLTLLERGYRDIQLLQVGAEGYLTDIERRPIMEEAARRISTRAVSAVLDAIDDARRQTDANADLTLVVDHLLKRIAEVQDRKRSTAEMMHKAQRTSGI